MADHQPTEAGAPAASAATSESASQADQWAWVRVQLNKDDLRRLRNLKIRKSCRHRSDAIRLAVNEGLKALGH